MTRKRFIKLVMGLKGLDGRHFSRNEAEKEATQGVALGSYSELYQAFYGCEQEKKEMLDRIHREIVAAILAPEEYLFPSDFGLGQKSFIYSSLQM